MIHNSKQGNGKSPDLIVVGAGVFGLWAARHAIMRGERVMVLEKRKIGDGASGGFLGALMPHLPDFWETKKQMQFDALSTMAEAVAGLEEDTGLNCGYRRCGRLMPLTHEKMPDHARRRIEGAQRHWVDKSGKQLFEMALLPPDFRGTIAEDWLSEGVAPFGATYDTLSARINPRAYIKALAAFVLDNGHGLGDMVEGADVVSFDETQTGVSVFLKTGEVLSAGRLVVANGWEAYGLLKFQKAMIGGQEPTGRGVKGQAVLVDFDHSDERPIIYDNGSYVVPHANGKIAIGSTSVDNWMPAGLGNGKWKRVVGRSSDQSGFAISADHPERPASVEPAQNRAGYKDGPLPEFTEMPQLSKQVASAGLVLASESFAGDVTSGDPMAEKLIEATRVSFDRGDMGFYNHALKLCPILADAKITERWANIRPRNTVPDPITGKTGTEPIFAALDGSERVQVLVGGFKISLGLGHNVVIYPRRT